MQNDFIDAIYALEKVDHELLIVGLKSLSDKFDKNKALNSRYVSNEVFLSFMDSSMKSIKENKSISNDKRKILISNIMIKIA